jgi:hypothetical protein
VRFLAAAALSLALCATALGGATRDVNVPRALAAQLPKVKRTTTVPILLPPTLPLFGNYKVYGSSFATRNSFDFDLSGAPNCGGANACFIAMFSAERGRTLPGRPNARLASGDPALFKPVTCGGSCSPNSLWFVHAGVRYSWQAKDLRKPEKANMIRMANQAIAAGPR